MKNDLETQNLTHILLLMQIDIWLLHRHSITNKTVKETIVFIGNRDHTNNKNTMKTFYFLN